MNIVHFEVIPLNPTATSKEEILTACRELIRSQGGGALNVRQVAAACGVSVGTVYNYFGSKAELAAAAVESVWYDIFRCEDGSFSSAADCIAWLFERLEYGNRQYPGFFELHSAAFAATGKPDGKARMTETWTHMTDMLCAVLRQDPRARPDAFDEDFTPEALADLLFSLLLAAQLRNCYDPTPALRLLRRLLY